MTISWSVIKDIIKKRNPFLDVVLGRSACVGQDVLGFKKAQCQRDFKFINVQKGRFDLLLSWLNGASRPKSKIIKPYILNPGVFGLIKQQASLKWLKYKGPKYLFMDIYSELTDQKFTHKQEGWSFCCHYSDINHQTDFDQVFASEGLLDEALIAKIYNDFFDWFATNHPGKKVVIVHYSARFDLRDKFKDRVKIIRAVLAEQTAKRDFIYNLDIDDDKFFCLPYHYTEETVKFFVDKWSELEKN